MKPVSPDVQHRSMPDPSTVSASTQFLAVFIVSHMKRMAVFRVLCRVRNLSTRRHSAMDAVPVCSCEVVCCAAMW